MLTREEHEKHTSDMLVLMCRMVSTGEALRGNFVDEAVICRIFEIPGEVHERVKGCHDYNAVPYGVAFLYACEHLRKALLENELIVQVAKEMEII